MADYGFNAENSSFTFRNGRRVIVRHVSYHLESAIDARLREEYPQPEPPHQTVTLPDGRTVDEANIADPDYQAQLQAWQLAHVQRFNDRLSTLLLRRGVEFELDQQAVDALRADAAELHIPLSADDRHVYLFDLCIGSIVEEMDLLRAIRGLSYPTEDQIAAAVGTFRG